MDAIPKVLNAATVAGIASAAQHPTRPGAVMPGKVAPAPAGTERVISNDQMKAAAERVSQHLAGTRTSVTFSVDKDLGRVVVRVINPETREVVRQIPQQEFLDLARQLESLAPEPGILTDHTA